MPKVICLVVRVVVDVIKITKVIAIIYLFRVNKIIAYIWYNNDNILA